MKISESLKNNTEKFMHGETSFFEPLYEESYAYLHTCVIHIVKNEDTAQDMLQDTYTEIYRNIGQLRRPDDFLSWASVIANRKCFAYLKKNKDVLVDDRTDDEGNETDYFENISDDEDIIPENIIDNREKIDIIRGIIDGLRDVQRACVIGFYYNGQKQDEIADELGLPVNTVKSHINRAKAKIKDEVGSIEKKQGIRLCSFAAFMGMFFMSETDAYAAESIIPAMSAQITSGAAAGSAVGSGSASGVAAGSAVGSGSASGVAAGAAAAVKAAGSVTSLKIAAAVAAGIIVAGGITGGVIYHNASVRQAQEAAATETAMETAEESDTMEIEAPADTSEEITDESVIPEEVSEDESDDAVVEDEETTDEPDEADSAEDEETADETADKPDEPAGTLITGSFDLDSVVDKYANASKIAELKDTVASGTRVYSGSGKQIGFFYNDGDGYELGYYPDYHSEMLVGDMDNISPFEDGSDAVIAGTSKWLMNCYSSTDGECDMYVDFYAVR